MSAARISLPLVPVVFQLIGGDGCALAWVREPARVVRYVRRSVERQLALNFS
jgi:hypothetical protein